MFSRHFQIVLGHSRVITHDAPHGEGGRIALPEVASSYCNILGAKKWTQLSLEGISCAIQDTWSFLNVVDMDGSCNLPCSQEMYRNDGLAHLAKPDHFFKNYVVNVSSWHSTHVTGSWMIIKSHTNRDKARENFNFCLRERKDLSTFDKRFSRFWTMSCL